MEQRFVSVLFYTVMAAVVVTCGAEWLHMWRGADPGWVGAYGSWFGGLGSFAAVVSALWIAGWQKRSHDDAEHAANLKKEKIILHKVRRHCEDMAISVEPLLKDEYSSYFQAHALRDQSILLRRTFVPEGIDVPILSLNELTFIDAVSTDIIKLYDKIELHKRYVNILCSTRDDDIFDFTIEMMRENIQRMRETSLDVSRYARSRLAEIS